VTAQHAQHDYAVERLTSSARMFGCESLEMHPDDAAQLMKVKVQLESMREAWLLTATIYQHCSRSLRLL